MTDAPRTPHAPPHTGDGREQLTRFFDWIRSSGVTRGSDRWLAGVCGAIARRTGLDPMIVRGIVVVLAILGGPVLFAYAVGWAFLPDATGRIHAEQLVRGVVEPATIAVIALIVFTFVPVTRGLWWEGPPVGWGMPDWLEATLTVGWSIAVTIGIIWLVVFFLRRVPAPGGGFPRAGYGSGAYGTAGTASFVGTPAGSTEAPAGAAFPGAASVIATGTPAGPGIATAPAPPRPEADAPRSAWDAWQEQNRAWQSQSRTWRAEHRAWRATHDRQRHPGAGFTSIVLGIALAAGAIAAGVNSAGAWSNASLLIGIAFTLGVLALGIIVAGVRGRDSGALGGFSFLAVLALLVFGVFPSGTQFTPFGAPTWAVSSTTTGAVPGYAIIAGNPTVDLSDLGGAPRFGESRIIDVWIGFGQTDLILPADRAVLVETNALIGGVEYDDQDSVDRGGLFFHDSRTVNGPSSRPVAQIRVWSLVGQVAVTTSEE